MDKKDLFSKIFIGEEVEFILTVYFKSEEQVEEGLLIQQNPMAVKGFVLDVDDENIYLGDTPEAVTRYVKKSFVVGGDIVKDNKGADQFDDLLNNFSGSSN